MQKYVIKIQRNWIGKVKDWTEYATDLDIKIEGKNFFTSDHANMKILDERTKIYYHIEPIIEHTFD